MKGKDILEWFDNYRIQDGIEVLLEARRKLSIVCCEMAEQEKNSLSEYLTTYQQRKVEEAKIRLSEEGTGVVKEAQSVVKLVDLRMKEAVLEGKTKGIKTMLSSYNKVLDSMASIINTLNR